MTTTLIGKTIKGNDIEIMIESAGIISNEFGIDNNLILFAKYKGEFKKLNIYFDNYYFELEGRKVFVISVQEGSRLMKEAEKQMETNGKSELFELVTKY